MNADPVVVTIIATVTAVASIPGDCLYTIVKCPRSFDYDFSSHLGSRVLAMVSNLTGKHFLDLPDEVIQSIVAYIPPRETVSLNQTCRRLANITSEPLLWKDFCLRCFKYWDRRHGFSAKLHDPSFSEWKTLYRDRDKSATIAQKTLNQIIEQEDGRLDRLDRILEIGYDAKDDLLLLYRNASRSPNHLAQRYWSHEALGSLHRSIALHEWNSIKAGQQNNNPTERCLAALDLFILDVQDEGDIDDIFTRLDSYAASVRTAYPDIDEQTPRQRATLVAKHLLQNRWTGIQDNRDYHSLDHMFLGVSIFSNNRNSVPLISAVIFCYVARQFNLQAQPCSYPFHVHALVQAPTGYDIDGNRLEPPYPTDPDLRTHLYMDPFQSHQPLTINSLEDHLRFITPTASPAQNLSYLSSASAQALTIRAAHNILSAPSHYSGSPLHPMNPNAATYAALYCLVMLPTTNPHPGQLRQHLAVLGQHFLEYFDLDVSLFQTHILPLTQHLPDNRTYSSMIHNLRLQDRTPKIPKLHSSPENEVVKYKVGQFFRHRRRGYLAIVYGWDPYCKMQEQWITMNQVDSLPNGRGQPFYNVIVEDESTRYVAEENIVLVKPQDATAEMLAQFSISIGKWFKRFDAETGCFVSNIPQEYPED